MPIPGTIKMTSWQMDHSFPKRVALFGGPRRDWRDDVLQFPHVSYDEHDVMARSPKFEWTAQWIATQRQLRVSLPVCCICQAYTSQLDGTERHSVGVAARLRHRTTRYLGARGPVRAH